MIKREELSDPASCMNRAREDEMTFVLLGRDAAAPAAIRAWIAERLRLGKDGPGDAQISEAVQCARWMELQQEAARENGGVEAGYALEEALHKHNISAEPCHDAIAVFLDWPEVYEILMYLCFQCGPMAHVFRAAGEEIPTKAEHEQAFVLRWMLKVAAKHGPEWRKACALELRAARDKAAPTQQV